MVNLSEVSYRSSSIKNDRRSTTKERAARPASRVGEKHVGKEAAYEQEVLKKEAEAVMNR